jgi:hypothetical protein
MGRIASFVFVALALLLSAATAEAQSTCSFIAPGAVLTAAQWNACFADKLDNPGFTPINPANLVGIAPVTVTPNSGLTDIGLNFNSSLVLDGSNNLGINLAHANVWTAPITVNYSGSAALTTSAVAANVSQGYGVSFNATHNDSTGGLGVYGSLNASTLNCTGGVTCSYLQGSFAQANGNVQGGAILSNLEATVTRWGLSGASPTGTITNAYGLFVDAGVMGATGSPGVTITTVYGEYINNQGTPASGVTYGTVYGLYIVQQTGGASNYSLVVGGGLSYFGGAVQAATVLQIGATIPSAYNSTPVIAHLATNVNWAVYNSAGTVVIQGSNDAGSGTIPLNLNFSSAGLPATSINQPAIGATSSDALLVWNSSAAAAGVQQWSPRVHWQGQGWKTNSTAGSQLTEFIAEVQPLQGAANPNATLVFSSQVNSAGYVPQVVMTDGNAFPSLSIAVGGTAALIAGASAGDLQVGRGGNGGFIFFGTNAGNDYIGHTAANAWVIGGTSTATTVSFSAGASAASVLQSTNNVSPSGDSLTLKATTISFVSYTGSAVVDCGASGTVSCTFNLAGSSSGAVSLIPQAAASGTVTLPNGNTTLAGLQNGQTFIAQNFFTIASTIVSATAATLDDIKITAATTTITGNTGSPITALSKVHLGQPTLTDSSAVTVTNAATLTIDNAPAQAGSVTITNAWALLVSAGATKFGGTVFMSGLTAGSGSSALCLNATASQVETDTSSTICGISALRYKNLIAEITPEQGLGVLSLRGESYRYKSDAPMQDGGRNVHVSLIADDMAALNRDCAEYSEHGVENYMDRCFEAYQVAYDKKLWEIIGKLAGRLPANDNLRQEVEKLRAAAR